MLSKYGDLCAFPRNDPVSSFIIRIMLLWKKNTFIKKLSAGVEIHVMTHFDHGSKRRSYRFSFLLTLVTLLLLPVIYKPISQVFGFLGIHTQSGGIAGSFLVFFLSLGLVLTLFRLVFWVFPLITRPGLKVYVLIGLLFILITATNTQAHTARSKRRYSTRNMLFLKHLSALIMLKSYNPN